MASSPQFSDILFVYEECLGRYVAYCLLYPSVSYVARISSVLYEVIFRGRMSASKYNQYRLITNESTSGRIGKYTRATSTTKNTQHSRHSSSCGAIRSTPWRTSPNSVFTPSLMPSACRLTPSPLVRYTPVAAGPSSRSRRRDSGSGRA